jgi:hypothetical protein
MWDGQTAARVVADIRRRWNVMLAADVAEPATAS